MKEVRGICCDVLRKNSTFRKKKEGTIGIIVYLTIGVSSVRKNALMHKIAEGMGRQKMPQVFHVTLRR